jgi:hypothetical protein
VQQHFDAGGVPVEAVLLVADRADRIAGDLGDAVEGKCGPRTSPAMTTRFVVASVSAATRMA